MSKSAVKRRSVFPVRNAAAVVTLAGLAAAATGCRNDDGSQAASNGQAQARTAQAIPLSRVQGFECGGLVDNGYILRALVLPAGGQAAPATNSQPGRNSLPPPPESSTIALNDPAPAQAGQAGQAEQVLFLRVPQAVLVDPYVTVREQQASSCNGHAQFLNAKLAAAKQASPRGALDWWFVGDVGTRTFTVALPGNQGFGIFAKYPSNDTGLDDIASLLRAGFGFRQNQVVSTEIQGKRKHMVHLGVNLLQLSGGGQGVEVQIPTGAAPQQAQQPAQAGQQPGREVYGPAGSSALPEQGKCVAAEDLAPVQGTAVFTVKTDQGRIQTFNVQVPSGYSWEMWADGVGHPICTGSKSQVVSYHFSNPGSRKISVRGKRPESAGGTFDAMVYKLITVNVGDALPWSL